MSRRKSGKKSRGTSQPAQATMQEQVSMGARKKQSKAQTPPETKKAQDAKKKVKSSSPVGDNLAAEIIELDEPVQGKVEIDLEGLALGENQSKNKGKGGERKLKKEASRPKENLLKVAPKEKQGIGPAVFLPCLFLALVLGIYLGTLLPDMYAQYSTMTKSTQAAETVPKMPPMPEAKPAPKTTSSIDSHISNLVSRTSVNPNDLQAWIELGNGYFDTNQPRKAIEAYKRALEIDPKNADVMTDLGIMYREAGDFENAVQSFRKARQINPRHLNSMFNEGVVLLNDLKMPEEARKAWQRLIEANPDARSPDGKKVSDMIKFIK